MSALVALALHMVERYLWTADNLAEECPSKPSNAFSLAIPSHPSLLLRSAFSVLPKAAIFGSLEKKKIRTHPKWLMQHPRRIREHHLCASCCSRRHPSSGTHQEPQADI